MGLTNAQYDEIMRGYQRRQNQNRKELEEREREAYGRIPELARIDEQIAAESTACVRSVLEDPGDACPQGFSSLRKRTRELDARRRKLLKEAGYPEDFLLPHYQCPDCQDTGFIGDKKCHCFRQAEIDLFYRQSNLYEQLRGEDFSSFSLSYYPETVRDPVTGFTAAQTAAHTLSECKRFVREFDVKFENIFLSGETGLGKTLLSRCIAKELLSSMHSVIYFSAYQLFDLLADASFGRTDEAASEEANRYVFSCDLLIIDDLGTEMVNAFVASQMFLVLNERIQRKKSTLISTNLLPENIVSRYSERVLSRISSDYLMLRLVGDDIRLQKKYNDAT